MQQNEWAFYPLFPTTVRTVRQVLGTEWALTASFVAMICGALAVLVMYSLVQHTAGRSAALWTVALFCFFPSAAVLQLAYYRGLGDPAPGRRPCGACSGGSTWRRSPWC